MANVTGPISTLPGYTGHNLPDGQMCDDHPDVLATVRVQMETDAFGSECADMCDACFAKHRAEMKEEVKREEKCDWCKDMATGLRDRRDYEEGFYGRVYRVCQPCIKKENDELNEEMDSWDDSSGWDD